MDRIRIKADEFLAQRQSSSKLENAREETQTGAIKAGLILCLPGDSIHAHKSRGRNGFSAV